MRVTYLHHDGFLIETEDTYLMFDYESGEMPALEAGKPLIAFVSHVHADHFTFDLFKVTAGHERTQYILSNDIHRRFSRKTFLKRGASEEQYSKIRFIHPDEELCADGWEVRALASTDQGVAFVLQKAGDSLRIYHAGDLNDWTWPEKDAETNQKEQDDYHRILEPLKGMAFDAAFVPCDPRQEDNYWRGIDYFMRLTVTKNIFPMHYWDEASVIDRLKASPVSEPYRDKIRDPEKAREGFFITRV